MPFGLTIVLRCLTAAAILAFAGARVAHAQEAVSTVTLDPRPIGRPQLGVAADGAAAVAWPSFRGSYVSSIVVSARPAGGEFGPHRTISTGGVEVQSGFALAVGAGGDSALSGANTSPCGGTRSSWLAAAARSASERRSRSGRRAGALTAPPRPRSTAAERCWSRGFAARAAGAVDGS